jgi:hypothetical protein
LGAGGLVRVPADATRTLDVTVSSTAMAARQILRSLVRVIQVPMPWQPGADGDGLRLNASGFVPTA